jgi:ubiquinone/menaquinone biosynthesis C-methylase UbiE
MSDIFKAKNILMTPLIRMVIKHPQIMESKLFLKAMAVFPDKISSTYDEKVGKNGIDYQAVFLEGLSCVRNEPDKLLDICTGTGFAAFLIAKQFKDTKIEAVDLSNEMIRISKEKAKEVNYCNLIFRTGNAMNLDYLDNEFDMVVITNAPIYLAEAVRVLKPGGEILVAYSFGGEVFNDAKEKIKRLFKNNRLEFEVLKSLNKGVFIFGRKEK